MKVKLAVYTLLVCCTATFMNGVLWAEEVPPGGKSNELRLTTAEEDAFAGHLRHGGALVHFESTVEVPKRITALVQVNGLSVDALYDGTAEKIVLDGYGAALSLQDRQALEELANRLATRAAHLEVGTPEGLLYRMVNFLSQAPVGMEIGRREIPKPATIQMERPKDGKSKEKIRGMESLSMVTEAATCQQGGDAGITMLGGGCSWLYYNSYHDASSHCYGNYPNYAGCNRGTGTWQDCLGRCGGSCGSNGAGAYTTDCKDHDVCCRTHGGCTDPWADSCGDEYWEADDDYFWAPFNCSGC